MAGGEVALVTGKQRRAEVRAQALESAAWTQILALPVTGQATSGQVTTPLSLALPICKMGNQYFCHKIARCN